MLKSGALLVVSGPSGAGKSTLIKTILQERDDVYFSISTTTRPKRAGEVDGRDYYFVSKEEFERDIEEGMFLEWANVHGNYYGTSLRPVMQALEEGKLVLFDIDVQGFFSIQKTPLASLMTSVFVTTPSMSELRRRLVQRGTDSAQVIQKRLQNAQEEMVHMGRYDYIIINSDLEIAKEQMRALATVARLKHSEEEIAEFIKQWRNT